MIPAAHLREVEASGVQARGVFSISMENSAHIMGILRDTMYSDKESAAMREYAANGWDAHRSIGLMDTALKIHIPTATDPTLSIRDFGPGMSEDDIFTIFPSYGASTKRATNNEVGTLGIGSKSGFAYTDSFTITSWNGDKKAVYVAYLDASDRGEINKIAEEPCGDETGLEIKIAVRPQDIGTFERKAVPLFRYMEPRPDINIDLPPFEKHATPFGFVSESGRRDWVAIMGCIPYRLDLSQVEPELRELGIFETLYHVHGGIYCEIGEVQISASREELKYSDRTKAAIVAKIRGVLDAYIEDTLNALSKEGVSGWDKRMKVRRLTDTLHLDIPQKFGDFSRRSVSLFDETPPVTFTLLGSGGPITKITVSEYTTVYFRNSDKSVKGYHLDSNPVILAPKGGVTREAVIAEFEDLCLKAGLDGLDVENISTVYWSSLGRGGRSDRVPNRKHHIRAFRLKTESCFVSPWSGTWEIEKREPKDSDVFVIIQEFKAVGWDKFHDAYRKDESLARCLGVEMPPIYGYKTTAKKPVRQMDCKGTHYKLWRIAFFRNLVTAKHREIDRLRGWADINDDAYAQSYRYRQPKRRVDRALKTLSMGLGPSHPLTMFFRQVEEGATQFYKLPMEERDTALRVVRVSRAKKVRSGDDDEDSEAFRARGVLLDRYPLLKTDDLGVFSAGEAALWVEYVRLVDRDLRSGQRLLLTAGKNRG